MVNFEARASTFCMVVDLSGTLRIVSLMMVIMAMMMMMIMIMMMMMKMNLMMKIKISITLPIFTQGGPDFAWYKTSFQL